MRNLWIGLVALFVGLMGIQSRASEERKEPKKAQTPRAASPSAKAKPKVQANSKAKTALPNADGAKRPPDPSEKQAEKLRK